MNTETTVATLKGRWKIVAGATLLGLVTAGFITLLLPVKYAAASVLYISSQGSGESSSDAYQGGLLSEQRVKSYVQLIQGNRIAAEVAQQLRLASPPADLAKSITASAQTDSVVIEVVAEGDSPQAAVAISDAASNAFTRLVAELEQPTEANRPPSVVARVVQPAQADDSPVEPRILTNLAVGLVLGLGIGASLALLVERLDIRVHTGSQLAEALDCTDLGTTFIEKPGDSPLPVLSNPHSPGAEAYRLLRTNMQYVDIEKNSKVILVTSTSSGEGKTVTSLNLAASLADAGARVMVLEADLRAPTFTRHLAVEGAVGLSGILRGNLALQGAIQKVRGGGGELDVVASGPLPPNPNELVSSHRMNSLLEEMRKKYEYVIVDGTPVGAVADAVSLAPLVDGVIIVSKAEWTTVPNAVATKNSLSAVSARIYGTVLTMSRQSSITRYGEYGRRLDDSLENLEDENPLDAVTTRTPAHIKRPTTPSPSPSRRRN